jgi:hypothetical protein
LEKAEEDSPNFSAGAALLDKDFNHLLEIRKRKSDEMGGGGDNESS